MNRFPGETAESTSLSIAFASEVHDSPKGSGEIDRKYYWSKVGYYEERLKKT